MSDHPDTALLYEYDENRHWRKSFIVDVDDPQRKPRLLWDLSTDEQYANPGFPVERQLANGLRCFARTVIPSTFPVLALRRMATVPSSIGSISKH